GNSIPDLPPLRLSGAKNGKGTNIPEKGTDIPCRSSLRSNGVADIDEPRQGTERNGMTPAVFFDWGMGKVTTLHNDAEHPVYYKSVDDLLDNLDQPTLIVSETTFESFNVTARRRVIQRAKDAGHTWLTTPNRQTGKHRRSMGYTDDEKTDEVDVQVIRNMARTRPECLKAPTPNLDPEDERAVRSRQANHELMVLRRTLRMVNNRSKLGFKTISAKDDYAAALIAALPAYTDLPDDLRNALGNGKAYSAVQVAAAGKATKYARNRSEYEDIAGLYAHGWGSQIRSDFHHWAWRFRRKNQNVTLSQFRRASRWLYHHLKVLDIL